MIFFALRAALATTFLAATLVSISATSFATLPNGIGDDVQTPDRMLRVITLNDQLTGASHPLHRAVLDDDIQARAWMQRRWEWVVNESETASFALETNAAHMQGTVTDVTNADDALLPRAAFHSAKDR